MFDIVNRANNGPVVERTEQSAGRHFPLGMGFIGHRLADA
jgi:hypothetical protein